MKRQAIIYLFIAFSTLSYAQDLVKKTLEAQRISEKMTVDGLLSESSWATAPVAKDFVFRWPTPGKTATQRTEVKVIYDDYAVYIGAYLYDNQPDSIAKALTQRDNNNNADCFYVLFDTYMDGQNGLEFGVTASNVQLDTKYAIANASGNNGDNDGVDQNWDTVWKSSVKMMPDGWVVEMEIPYSALRFPKKEIQDWHVNFSRRIFRKGEGDCWNPIKAEESGTIRQSGILKGIKNIKAPIRLQASPFLAGLGEVYYDKNGTPKTSTGRSFNAGMDLKYGLNDAFTLDATIIPDFGQVRSDNQVVNLSAFEVRFDEFRPFFMEGTELFNKGGLFYSRRIGGRPINRYRAYNQVNTDEEIIENPNKTQLYNTTKISGRTNGGTGIGFLNAVEGATFATLANVENKSERLIETSPLTNKNILVIDQNLKYNSSIALINTNVMRTGSTYDANVTGLNWNLKNKKNSYSLTGNYALSQIYQEDTVALGHKMNIDVNKISGKKTWGASYSEISNSYNQNDLGYQTNYNERNYNVWGGYNQFDPVGKWNNYWINLWSWYTTLQERNAFNSAGIGLNIGGNTKNFNNMGINFNFNLLGFNDYFEPRTYDFKTYFRNPGYIQSNIWYNSDRRKKLRFYASTWSRVYGKDGRFNNNTYAGTTYQVSKKLRFGVEISKETSRNDRGYTGVRDAAADANWVKTDDIVFGKRNVNGFDNSLNATYTFNNKANLVFRLRHYWQQVKYEDFMLLNKKDGSMLETSYSGLDKDGKNLHNINANFFNIDCVFTWRFAPGSDLFITWKNAIYNENQELLQYNYFGNTGRLIGMPQTNSLNIKMLYFLDYNEIKRKLNK